jgi:hypothetical protein
MIVLQKEQAISPGRRTSMLPNPFVPRNNWTGVHFYSEIKTKEVERK